MTSPGRLRLAAVALLLTGAACPGEPPSLTGFEGIPWGASRDSVIARTGPPWRESALSPTERWLEYPGVILAGQMAEPHIVVDRDSGMVHGGYLVRIRRYERSCDSVFDQVVTLVREQQPRLEGEIRRSEVPSGFCAAVLAGDAHAEARWSDPANGAQIIVLLRPREPFMRVTYSSALGVRRAARETSTTSTP